MDRFHLTVLYTSALALLPCYPEEHHANPSQSQPTAELVTGAVQLPNVSSLQLLTI